MKRVSRQITAIDSNDIVVVKKRILAFQRIVYKIRRRASALFQLSTIVTIIL